MDEDTGEIVDDAQGWGYKTARNAYRAHAYKKQPKSRRRKAASAERRVKRLMDANPGLHDEILADMVIAAKEGVEYTADDLVGRLEGIDLHGLTAARILSNLQEENGRRKAECPDSERMARLLDRPEEVVVNDTRLRQCPPSLERRWALSLYRKLSYEERWTGLGRIGLRRQPHHGRFVWRIPSH